MKANELMIGDWVYDTILKCNTQVEILSLSGIRGDCNDNIWNEKTFEPIPLTAEILEKNGWYVPLLKSWWEHPDIAFWMRGYTDGTFELMIDEDSDISFCTIRYVHELQHALRLCGIDKEIVL